ncbi:MAG: PIN domain-containing protein [Betaproteobacteria bacterium]|nr:PIN domain-containing protein [Betaproteobacteria bacterium]
MLVDTDVLIWLTRGHPGAATRLKRTENRRISAVTYIELAQGCRNKSELARVRKALNDGGMPIAPVTEIICERAMRLIDRLRTGCGPARRPEPASRRHWPGRSASQGWHC